MGKYPAKYFDSGTLYKMQRAHHMKHGLTKKCVMEETRSERNHIMYFCLNKDKK